MKNIFIEGVQGSGKSTLLEALSRALPQYHAYKEGDLCPCELAWCGYLTEKQYQTMLLQYSDLAAQIRSLSSAEGDMRIVAFTKVKTADRGFYSAMENHLIYQGRIPYDRFCAIILDRYRLFSGSGNIFECALLQNAIETMMLFYEKSDDEIMAFYSAVYHEICNKDILVLYLDPMDLRGNIDTAKKERILPDGTEIWWNAVLSFFDHSPYAVSHNLSGFDGFLKHLARRVSMEKRILKEIMGSAAQFLRSKAYRMEEILEMIAGK